MTPLQVHVDKWKSCTRCILHQHRKQVVHIRGTSLPCDVLFVGEAPGVSENALGDPFVGPAGKRMDLIVAKSLTSDTSYCLINLIGCIPLDEDKSKAEEPETECIEACSPRVRELVEMANPKLIVCVGKLSSVWLNSAHLKNVWKTPRTHGARIMTREYDIHPGSKIPRVEIMHPSAIIRANIAQQGLLTQRAVVTVRNAVMEYVS